MLRCLLAGCLLMLGLPPDIAAQTSMAGGAHAAALGGAHTALAQDPAGLANPASWATLSGRTLSFFASEAFGLSALRLGAVHYAEPTRPATFAVGARTFGFEEYREVDLHAGLARGFGLGSARRFFVGLRVRLHRVRIAGYGSAGALATTVGGLVRVLPTLDAGFQATNLHQPKLAGREALPRVLALGLAYRPTPGLRLLGDIVKDVRFPLAVRAGLEVRPHPSLALRAGAATEPVRFTAGIGLRAGRLAADVAAEQHEALGWSPAVGLGLYW